MRKPLSVIAAAAVLGFAYGTIMGPGETNADNELMRDPVSNAVSIHGLRVALPSSLANFPKELVPLP
ncbi:MAG: hypothetical protein WB499_06425 [Pseudolabrys sp.]